MSTEAALGFDSLSPGKAEKARERLLELRLRIDDAEVAQELLRIDDEVERQRYAQAALRIGVLTLRMARGEVDARAVHHAGDKILGHLREFLGVESQKLVSEIRQSLKDHVHGDASEMAKTLASKLGDESPIFKMLSPNNSEGLKAQLAKVLEGELQKQREVVLREFSLDEEQSALSRFRKAIDELRSEMRGHFEYLRTRKELATQTNLQGKDFETALLEWLDVKAHACGDVAESVGAQLGKDRSRKGDMVIELGTESGAPGIRVVWEAKSAENYTVKKAIEELKEAKKNRHARHGVFVFLQANAPKGLRLPLLRQDDDLLVVWNPEDPASEVLLSAAYGVSRALAVRQSRRTTSTDAAFQELDTTLRALQRQLGYLEKLKQAENNIRRHCDAMSDQLRLAHDEISERLARLTDFNRNSST